MLRKYCLRSSRCPRAGVGPVVLTRGGRHSSSLQRQPFEKQRCAVGDRCPPASSEVSFCLRILRFEDGHRSWDQGMPQTALRIFWPRQLQAHCSAEETLLLIGYWLQPSQRSSRFCTLVVCTVVPPTSHPLLDARLRGVACPDVPGWHVRAACLGSWTPNDPSADHRQQRQQQEHASKMACSRPAEDCSQVPWLSATGSQQWHLDNRSTGWTVMLPAAVVVHHCVSLDAEPIQVFVYDPPAWGHHHFATPPSTPNPGSSTPTPAGLVPPHAAAEATGAAVPSNWPWLPAPSGWTSLQAALCCCNAQHVFRELLAEQPQPRRGVAANSHAGPRGRHHLHADGATKQQQPLLPVPGSMLMNCWRHLAAWRSVQSSWRRKPVHTSSVQPNPQAHSSRSHSSSQQQRQPPGPGDAVWDISAGHALLLHTEQQLVSCAAQQLAGVVAAALLLFHWEVIAAGAAVAAGAAQEWLLSTVEWLAGGTPGGLKLHAELSFLLGAAAQVVLDGAAALALSTHPWPTTAAVAATAAACCWCGLSGGMRVAGQVLLVVCWPLEVLYWLAAGLYRLQLRYLGVTWRLMRGKYQEPIAFRNLRRRRQQHQQQQQQQQPPPPPHAAAAAGSSRAAGTGGATPRTSSSNGRSSPRLSRLAGLFGPQQGATAPPLTMEHLIVGVLLFTPLLALLPTTAVWYIFATLLHGGLVAAGAALQVAAWLAGHDRLYLLLRRLRSPGLFPGGVLVEVLQQGATGDPAVAACRQQRDPEPPSPSAATTTAAEAARRPVTRRGRGATAAPSQLRHQPQPSGSATHAGCANPPCSMRAFRLVSQSASLGQVLLQGSGPWDGGHEAGQQVKGRWWQQLRPQLQHAYMCLITGQALGGLFSQRDQTRLTA